jgi:hypothetical protein
MGIVLSILLITLPALAQSTTQQEQQEKVNSDSEQGQKDGARDGAKSVNSLSWLAIGCGGLIVGIIASVILSVKPNKNSLIGKSLEYVKAYTDAFKDAAKDRQCSMAVAGCLISSVLMFAFVKLYLIPSMD